MEMARKAVPHDHYRLVGTYERLRRTLLDLPSDGRLDQHLSYWVLPSDRRLPIAFLDQPLRALLAQTLEELMETPGVGQKKILGFFDLLRRIAKAPCGDAVAADPPSEPKASPTAGGYGFDASSVSEALWSTWCETVRRNEIGDQKLGRLAPSLQSLPTVIWHTPLNDYVDLSLAKIRRLRTHGEKRVQAILEVFCTAHEALSTAALNEHLNLELSPRFIGPLSRWLTEVAWESQTPAVNDVQNRLVDPLLAQIEVDLGTPVADLARGRLRSDSQAPTVKQQSETLGVTRARVYQLLDDCAKVMDVRWPEGRWLLATVLTRTDSRPPDGALLAEAVASLFYPEERPARHLSGAE